MGWQFLHLKHSNITSIYSDRSTLLWGADSEKLLFCTFFKENWMKTFRYDVFTLKKSTDKKIIKIGSIFQVWWHSNRLDNFTSDQKCT